VLKSIKKLRKREWEGRPFKKPSSKELGFFKAKELKEGFWWIRRATEQAHVIFGTQGLKVDSKDHTVLAILSSYLGGGMSSKLFQEIREKRGLAYSVHSGSSSYYDSGVFDVYVGCQSKQVPACLQLIEESLLECCHKLLDETELEAFKQSLKGALLIGSDSTESRMQGNAIDQLYFKECFPVEELCKEIDHVSPKDIRRVARKLFSKQKWSIMVLGPRPSPSLRRKLRTKYAVHFPKKFEK
jgi:predicted Zn-dependent peptidase